MEDTRKRRQSGDVAAAHDAWLCPRLLDFMAATLPVTSQVQLTAWILDHASEGGAGSPLKPRLRRHKGDHAQQGDRNGAWAHGNLLQVRAAPGFAGDGVRDGRWRCRTHSEIESGSINQHGQAHRRCVGSTAPSGGFSDSPASHQRFCLRVVSDLERNHWSSAPCLWRCLWGSESETD